MNASVQLRTQGIRHFEKREFTHALHCIDAYLKEAPGDRELFNYQARVLEALGRNEEALHYIDRSLALDPKNIDEHCNRALILTRLSRREEALHSLDLAFSIDAGHVGVLLKRAILLHQLGRRAEALVAAMVATKLDPKNLEALNTRGMIYDDLDRRDDALNDFLSILKVDPNHSGAITNRGILHGRAGEFREALAQYDRSLALNPDQLNAFYNRAVVRLVLGDWRQGFQDFECRWQLFPHEAGRLTRLAPQWRGESGIAGKTILLHHEQGFGDTLQFARYAPLVAALGAQVIMAVPAGLKSLMATLPGAPRIVGEGEPIPKHDLHCPLMSLPLAFKTTPDSVPNSVPYLIADANKTSRWRQQVAALQRSRIGLVWGGRRYPPINYARDMSLEWMRPILTLDADFVCLHTEFSADERTQLASLTNVHCLGLEVQDFADTAALIENLDLVITVDTAVAHLAGALGKPVWLMNRYASCWRWLLGRTDSPWYPSMRLFRQPQLGDWGSVVAQVCAALHDLLQCRLPTQKARAVSEEAAQRVELASLLQTALDAHHKGDLTRAIAQYRHILTLFPNQFDSLHYLGVAMAQAGDPQSAIEPFMRAVAIRPNDAGIRNHYGNVLLSLGKHGEAVECYGEAIKRDGAVADFHFNLGVALTEAPNMPMAIAAYRQAIALEPEHGRAHNNLGNLRAELGDHAGALLSFDRAIAAQSGCVDAWVNRCHLLRRLHRYEEALLSSEQAINCAPKSASAHNGRGATLAAMGRYDEALASYERAMALDPGLAEACWNTGLIKLAQGDFLKGWPLYEYRWKVKSLKLIPSRPNARPLIATSSVRGQTVVLHAEQGYGDTIQFCRYATVLATRGARVVLSVPQTLTNLLKSVRGVQAVVSQNDVIDGNFHTSLLSLPHWLQAEVSDIPAACGYLRTPATVAQRWAHRQELDRSRLRVGIAWAGRPSHANDRNRSMSLNDVALLFDLAVQWIALQKEIGVGDGDMLTRHSVTRFDRELVDFSETAGLIENLDLVITVDTAIAHLAGALGKPVWILLPYVADWRWLLRRSDSPWYASARLFRQPARGDWRRVVGEVAAELRRWFDQS